MEIHIDVEMSKHQGRIDAKIKVEGYLYIMEFKLDPSADKAIEQIKTQKYADAFNNTSKTACFGGDWV
ncbi:MAG: PD-(D/E)XK nuclease domain-containing protein [Chitinophagales bacterium]